jgi:outer membrane receptor protein involved in Fe transport
MKMNRSLFGVLLSLSLVSVEARGNTGVEEALFSEVPMVVTASLKRQALDKVPGSMTVITAQEIRDYGLQNLQDAFTLIPGFRMYQETFGLMSPVVRGYQWASANLKVMVDGHSVNELLHKGLESWTDMPLDEVQQIEVIRGPGSSLYGSDAFSAVVNIITREQPGGRAYAGGGTLGAWTAGASLASARDRDLRYKVAFNKLGEEGGKLRYETDYLTGFTDYGGSGASQSLAPTDSRKKLERHEGAARVEYGGLSLTVRNVDNRRQWSEGYVGIQAGGRSWVNTRAKYAEAAYKLDLPDGSHLSLTGSYDVNVTVYTGKFLKDGFTWFGSFPGYTFPEGAYFRTYGEAGRDQAHGLWTKTWGGIHPDRLPGHAQ